MTHAYDEMYLDDAMKNLGEAVDYAVNSCSLGIDEFMNIFISTNVSESFGNGHPKYISGTSGTELTMMLIEKSGKSRFFPDPSNRQDRSPEYWAGWIIAYYQWCTGRSFKEINNVISMSEVRDLYHPLHEADITKSVDTLNKIYSRENETSKLQKQRKIYGITQSELAQKSGVNLRTLQQYETRAKDLSKASVSVVISLAKVLGCGVQDLVE